MSFTLTPAYGRDYKSRKAVEADLLAGKDFVACDPFTNSVTNIPDLAEMGEREVRVRYDRLMKQFTFKVPAPAPKPTKAERQAGAHAEFEAGMRRLHPTVGDVLASKVPA